jgi:hypothetical protein
LENLKDLENALKELRDELAEVYNRYLEEVIASKKRK